MLLVLSELHIPLRLIARRFHRSHSTLSRELRRNRHSCGTYIPWIAHLHADERKRKQRSEARVKSPFVYQYVLEGLQHKWSPEEIAGRLPLDHPGQSIHFESIYRYIYSDRSRGLHLWQYLTHARYKRMKKSGRRVKRLGRIPDAVSIEQRPQEVNARKIIGHWETDNLIGKITDKAAVSTTVERVLKYTILRGISEITSTISLEV